MQEACFSPASLQTTPTALPLTLPVLDWINLSSEAETLEGRGQASPVLDILQLLPRAQSLTCMDCLHGLPYLLANGRCQQVMREWRESEDRCITSAPSLLDRGWRGGVVGVSQAWACILPLPLMNHVTSESYQSSLHLSILT